MGSGGARVRADDVDRLNGALAANVRFQVVRPASGSTAPGARRPDGAAGVLVARLADGRERRAASPLAGASSRRARLLLLSGCLAECAMSLGLGTAVYRRPPGAHDGRGDGGMP
jgi:hypothetical protein